MASSSSPSDLATTAAASASSVPTVTASKENNASSSTHHCNSSFFQFCCINCGKSSKCYHKLDIAQRIWFTPNDVRTNHELRSISSQEREVVWADITANSKGSNYRIPTETEPFLTQCLDEMEVELSNMKLSDKMIYERVKEISPDYVSSKDFRLRFLRCERFCPKLASKRLVKHFQMKYDLFKGSIHGGTVNDVDDQVLLSMLGRDVQLSDLSRAEQHLLHMKTGTQRVKNGTGRAPAFRFLTHPDHAGRDILFDRPSQVNYDDIQSEVSLTPRWTDLVFDCSRYLTGSSLSLSLSLSLSFFLPASLHRFVPSGSC